ncbi:hypothetical protein [Aulosira sp. FACHB-615]|uniref:hypothetical protein n=1 Tax=Aulosira sp. FACHB-615 TaxID=2692777 RepID=UPI0016841B51|nr:hypothetical protein [Aulosira sp. FACHB-615]MBD2489012.1 hypothetical protein [Aulosira sp. FACHB-615]
MTKLPFKTAPKGFEKITVGNSEIGELELPRYFDLTPNERLFIASANLTDIRAEAVKLARTIATKSQKTLLDTYNALVYGDAQSLGDYLEEFLQFQDLMERTTRERNFVLATVMIGRIVPEWTIEKTKDVNEVPPALVKEIANFARKEESGWTEEPAPEITEEDLGNLATAENQTGEKSTGDAEDTGRKKKGSVKEVSEASQPG